MCFFAIKKTPTGGLFFWSLNDFWNIIYFTFTLNRPLDTAQKVKEKFDDIFNTTRYVKCQDEIRKQIKEVKDSEFILLNEFKKEMLLTCYVFFLFF